MATEPGDVDVAAMSCLQNGDDLALNEIMDRWQLRITSYLLRLTGNPTLAGDLAQETFVRVYLSRNRYRPKAAFSTWLFTIAGNLVRDQVRWRSRHPTVPLDIADEDGAIWSEKIPAERADVTGQIEQSETAALIREAVLSLPDEQRQAVVLFEYEDLSHEEIARIAKCTRKAVEARLYRARSALREKLCALLET